MTISQMLDMIDRGETQEQYMRRIARIKKLSGERDDLIDAIDVLGDDARADRKKRRLKKVMRMISDLK